jgi:hypothetical protein
MKYALAQCSCEEKFDPHVYVFTGPCVVTGKPHSVAVPAAGLFAYHQGAKIQDAFPGLSADDREFLLSGFSPDGWEATFGGIDDE